MKKAHVTAMFEALEQQNPSPQTELEYDSPYQLLIAVLLSAQATDVGVNKATKGLFALAPTAEAMVALGLQRIKQEIRTIGLFNTKAANLLKTSEILVQSHNGEVPESREQLEALPGVGRKTANVVLNTAFGHPTMAVDTHIYRVSNRTGLAPGKTPLAVEKALLKAIPGKFLLNAHHWLILHGRYTCKARQPQCLECVVESWCRYVPKIDETPPSKKKVPVSKKSLKAK
ncbi:MAG: endonuclease III [Lysobacterales bacterium]